MFRLGLRLGARGKARAQASGTVRVRAKGNVRDYARHHIVRGGKY